ncbi:MAG TPA: FHA domain-containing protein [Gammaproteobacteria bacterium]
MPKLYLRCDNKPVSQHELRVGETRIGRRTDNDIHVDDIAVSGQHALLRLRPDEHFKSQLHAELEDCGSTNGTTVNGKSIKRQRLNHGDIIRLGHHELVFHDEQVASLGETAIYIPEAQG